MPFSASRLSRLRDTLGAHIDRGEMPGLVAAIAHHDEVHIETLGALSFTNPAPMSRDTMFRIASLSKLIAAVAAMVLLEDCAFRLDDPIDPWIPELANRRVLKFLTSQLDETVAARRAITVRDLLTFRMGIGSVMAQPDTYPIQKAIRDLKIGGDGPPCPSQSLPTDQWLRNLGSLPLLSQPGERWYYHVSCDVLGVLISRVSGKPLGAFVKERICDPLGMKDTSFHVPNDQLDRLPDCYQRNHETNSLEVFDAAAATTWSPEPPAESAGGGMVSTLDDYLTFSRMLLNYGRHGVQQILSRASVELMTSDHLTPANRAGGESFFGNFSTWGLGIAVDTRRVEIYNYPGRYGWTGGTGTTAYNDPANRVIGILFTQRMMDSPEPPKVFTDFWTRVYAAIV